MSRRSIEDLKFQLEAIRERKIKEKKIFISLGLNFVIISVEIIGILTYKLMTRGYI